MLVTEIVEVNVKLQENYNYVIEYWKEHYNYSVGDTGWLWFGISDAAFCVYLDYYFGDIILGRCSLLRYNNSWLQEGLYSIKSFCEQDFQDILIPTQNELVLFELKYGFGFPFQVENKKHPLMMDI